MSQQKQPNEHGVYDKADADKSLFFVADTFTYVKAYFMEMPSGLWATGYNCQYGDGGQSGPLMDMKWNEETERGAIDDFLWRIVEDLKTALEGSISNDKKDKCRDLLTQITQHQNQGRLF